MELLRSLYGKKCKHEYSLEKYDKLIYGFIYGYITCRGSRNILDETFL